MKEKLSQFIRWVKTFVREKFNYRGEDLPYYITIIISLIVFGAGLKIFIELADELAENELGNFDSAVTDFVISFRSAPLTAFFTFVTDLGDRYTYIVIIIALGFFFWFRLKNWRYTLQMVAVLLLATASNIVIKHYINRARPTLEHLVTVNTLSFPSGHSMSAMAFYGFLIYLALTLSLKLWVRILLVTILGLLIMSIGMSRIYLGVHFPSDVAAGFAGGLLWVTLCAIILNITGLWIQRKKSRAASL